MQEIDKQRISLRELRRRLSEEESKLKELYDIEARKNCPLKIGERIEYTKGRFGEISKIFHQADMHIVLQPLEEQSPKDWAISGKKINKTGKYGKKDFGPLSVHSHAFDKHVFRRKTLSEHFGIE
jgi:hypothetical protein